MGKLIAKDYYVKVNGVDLSDHAFNVDTPDSKEQVDVSGFNASGNKEFLQGEREQEITVQFLQDFASSSVHATLQPLYESGSAFAIIIRPTSSIGSTTNPSLSGSAILYSYNGLAAQLGSRAEITATFKPATNAAFSWGTV